MEPMKNMPVSKKAFTLETIICMLIGIILVTLCWFCATKKREFLIGIDIGVIFVISNVTALLFYPNDVDNLYLYLYWGGSVIINILFIIFFRQGLVWADTLAMVFFGFVISFRYIACIAYLSSLNYNEMCNMYDESKEQSDIYTKKRNKLIMTCNNMNDLIRENREFYIEHTKTFLQILNRRNISKQLQVFHIGNIEDAEQEIQLLSVPQQKYYTHNDLHRYQEWIKTFKEDIETATKEIERHQSIADIITKNLECEKTYLLTYSKNLSKNLPEETKKFLSDRINEQLNEKRKFFQIENIEKYRNELKKEICINKYNFYI